LATSCATNDSTADTVQKGTWNVSYYYDTDHDETSSFNGYNFTFSSNGVVTAENRTLPVTGTWSTGPDDRNVILILDFGTNIPFNELNDDWHVIELTDAKIRMSDSKDGGSSTSYLTFVK